MVTREGNTVKGMKEMILIVLVVGLLLAGTLCSIPDVYNQESEDIDFSGDGTIPVDGTTINGGGGSGGGPAPG